MRVRLVRSILAALFLVAVATTGAFAQGSFFTSLSGIVVDSSGGVIPGADVKVKNVGTGAEATAVSGSDGGFTIPSLTGGTYSVTVSLMGFKTAVLNSVSLQAAVPANVRVVLAVGAVEENVTVVGDSALVVQTQSPSIATNLTGNQITSLPLTSRNALDSLTSLPGFSTSGTARNSSVSGLPRSSINITLDGMSIQDNYLKTTDGYFARLTPLLDSVEEVTVTTAGNTADATGQGSVQVRFVTKMGTNSWTGTAYEYFRHDGLNANTWFRNRDLPPDPATGLAPKDKLRQYNQGVAQGGPILRNKAFFFFNYEEQRSPAEGTLQRVILSPEASAGVFSYNVGGTPRQVNLLQLAAANGQLATPDPVMAKLFGDIQASTKLSGSVSPLSNPLVQQYTWSMPTQSFNPSPTFRVDFELTQRHRLTGSMNYRHINSTPDTTNNAQLPFPGFATTGSQQSTRWTTSESLRSTFTTNLVNEFRIGGTGGATLFSPELEPSMWNGAGGVGNQAGFRLAIGGTTAGTCCGTGFVLTNPGLGNGQSSREASTTVIEDTATWIKGKHNVTFGGSMVQADVWLQNQTLVPTINFGLIGSESANSMFSAANFPGASATDLQNATSLYAMLTGRIASIQGDARINPAGDAYVPLGLSRAEGRMREFDFFAADSWRVTPSVTVSAGVRYVLANPFYPVNNSYTTVTEESLYGISGVGNLFKPGTLTGTKPVYVQYPAGTYAYNPDRNNLAPSGGFAWQLPGHDKGFARLLLGSEEGDSVIRGGGAMAFQRPGMSDFTGAFGANQGLSVNLNRDNANGNLGPLPLLLRNTSALTLPVAPSVSSPQSPSTITNTANMFDTNLQMPYTQSYTIGWQRKLGRDTAFELRYVGSRHRQDWETVNINEINIKTNGFVDEFRKAQANLQANIAAGRGTTFAYTGAPGTSPLPTFAAFFDRVPVAQANDPTKYASTQWTNSTNLGFLAAMNPNPFGFASTNTTTGFIGNGTFRNNAVAAGIPANYFVANPDLIGPVTGTGAFSGANLTTNVGGTHANSVQMELRKRLSKGFQFQASYTWANAWVQQRYGFQKPLEDIVQTGQTGNVQHAVKANWLYELPFGKDQRWGGNATGLKDVLIGGWSIDGVARLQTGEMMDFGDVRLVGMTQKDLQDAIQLRVGPTVNGVAQIYILPDDIMQNTVKAFAVSATSANGYGALGAPTGRYLAPANGPDCIETSPSYGDCGVRSLVVNGPRLIRFDLSAVKRVKVRGSWSAEFKVEMLNALNAPYFNPASTAGIPLGMTSTGNLTAPGGPILVGTPVINALAGSSVDSFRLTQLLGDNQARIIQVIWRLRW
jgi:hypothetical protein